MCPELTIKPFSHIHPLQLSKYDESKTTQSKAGFCAACKLKASEWICSCNDCNFFLHFQCSIAPQHIRHPFHRGHDLSLVPDHGFFKCRACGDQGFNFAYTCTRCKVYLHFDCARSPQVLTHQSHRHTLDLTFSLPNEKKTFDCNVCGSNIISNCWRYKCDGCGRFDAHLDCAKSNKIVAQISSSSTTSMKKKESNYDTGTPSKEKKSSGATSYKGKEKGSNSRYTDDRPFNQKQFGDQNDYGHARWPPAPAPANGREGSRYTQDTSRRNDHWEGDGNRNANRKIYASSKKSGADGGSGYSWQQNPVRVDHFSDYGSDDSLDGLDDSSNSSRSGHNQKRFGNRTDNGSARMPAAATSNRPEKGDCWDGNRNRNANKKNYASGAGSGGGYGGGGYGSVDIQDDLDSDSSTNYGDDDEDYLY